MADELAPCRVCDAPCSVQVFEGPHIEGTATIWLCSRHKYLAGGCKSETAYLTEQAWNGEKEAYPDEKGMVMELRDKVCRLIREDDYCDGPDEAIDALAESILALPEIAEALEAQAALVRADLVVHEGELHHLIRPNNP